ncbi:MAG: AMP-binding protein, partial [Proteobacteria bacterium]|nr:AMP-binding protein [Pseudomonadota bacterium]
TVPRLFRERAGQWPERTAFRKKELGLWRDITWREYAERVRHTALGLKESGVGPGDRVAIISQNRPEWLYVDVGVQCLGGVSVGILPTSAPAQVEEVIRHSDSRVCVLENRHQLEPILEVRKRLQGLELVIVLDPTDLPESDDLVTVGYRDLLELGRSRQEKEGELFDGLVDATESGREAIIIYTAGATGPPKGVVLTHRNIIASLDAVHQAGLIRPDDELLSFLPLSHFFERSLALGMLINGNICNFAEGMSTVPRDIREVRPTVFGVVPRVWEKFFSFLVMGMKDSTRFEKWAYEWALGLGGRTAASRRKGRRLSAVSSLLFGLADWCVLRRLRRFIGLDRVRFGYSVGGPISFELLGFYDSLGIEVGEAYGLTESSGIIALHRSGRIKPGTTGQPLAGVEIKIDDNGQILVKGPMVFQSYHNQSRSTSAASPDGWWPTGDAGLLDQEGHLIVRGRLEDVITTSDGQSIEPAGIETRLKSSPYISDALVVGHGRQYLTALIMVDEEGVINFSQENQVPFTDYASLTRAPEVIGLIEREVHQANQKASEAQRINDFRLIDVSLGAGDQEVTPTMKLKRTLIIGRFSDLIDSMYGTVGSGGQESARPGPLGPLARGGVYQ